jgi:hypothetical protein
MILGLGQVCCEQAEVFEKITHLFEKLIALSEKIT